MPTPSKRRWKGILIAAAVCAALLAFVGRFLRDRNASHYPDPRLPEAWFPMDWFEQYGASVKVDQLLFVDVDGMTFAFRGQAKLEKGSPLSLRQGFCDGEQCLVAIGRAEANVDRLWTKIERAEAAGLDVQQELLPAYLKTWHPFVVGP